MLVTGPVDRVRDLGSDPGRTSRTGLRSTRMVANFTPFYAAPLYSRPLSDRETLTPSQGFKLCASVCCVSQFRGGGLPAFIDLVNMKDES